jgi:serine/threonine protein kinase/tetratricopeptide (TPR) repeat protein
MEIKPSEKFGPYRMEAKLGAGGMGAVWRALDTRLDRYVAIKFLLPSESEDPLSLARFHRESVAVTRLNHPNILTVYEAGEIEQTPYLCSELVEGENLHSLIESQGSLAPSLVANYGRQLLDALEAAHSMGIVHRDIKPLNVMVRPDGVLKLLDFGIARRFEDTGISGPGRLMGTPRYMAPERLAGKEMDPRSDLFSVGAMLYEMYAGRPAFKGQEIAVVVQAILNEVPEPLCPKSHVSQVIEKALSKDPEHRYQTAREMRDALGSNLSAEHSVGEVFLSPARPTLVVLPVAHDSANEAVAQGLHLEANARLALHPRLRLLSPLTYGAREKISLRKAQELGVDFVIESRLRGNKDRCRFHLQMVRVEDGEQVLGDTFETSARSDFDLEDRCLDWLDRRLRAHFREQCKDNREAALEQALLGASSLDPDSIATSVERLEALVCQYPDFAPAKGRLALALVGGLRYHIQDRDSIRRRAMLLAEESLALDPELACAELALSKAMVGPELANWERSWYHLKKAFLLAPTDPAVNEWRATYDLLNSRPDLAVRRAMHLLSSHHDSFELLFILARGYLCKGEFRSALDTAEKILRTNPEFTSGFSLVFLSDAYLGNVDRALRFAGYLRKQQSALGQQGIDDPILEALLFIARALESPERAVEDFNSELAFSARISTRISLTGYGILNDRKEGRKVLQRLSDLGFRNLASLSVDPFLAGFHGQDWYEELVSGMAPERL